MMLADFNAQVGMLLPSWIWDWLQVTLGLSVAFGSLMQRAFSSRFSTSAITCTVDAITTRIAQTALAVIGTVALLVALDGLLPPPAPPRSLVVIFLGAYFAIQIRIIYQVLAHSVRRLLHHE